MLTLTSEEYQALQDLANQELRSLRDQLRLILRQSLTKHGFIPNQYIQDIKMKENGDFNDQ